MLTIKCAKCKTKIMKYKKIGEGRVLKCWKNKITRLYDGVVKENNLICDQCGCLIGEIKDDHVDMNSKGFTYTGTKD